MLSTPVAHALAALARACKLHGPASPEAETARYHFRVERTLDRARALVADTPELNSVDRRRLADALSPSLGEKRAPRPAERSSAAGARP